MYKIVKITFAGTDGALADAESLKQKAEDFLNALVNSGQIMEEYLLLWREGILSAMVSIPWKDALDDRYASEYVRQNAEGLSIRCEVVGDDALSTSPCSCLNSSWYLLDMGSDNISSPLYCGDCGEEIPLCKIPYLDQSGDHHRMISWQRVHQAVIRLWTESLSDRFSRRQIEDPVSRLNRLEREFASALEEKLGKPVFLYLENPLSYFTREKPLLTDCPVCGKPLRRKNFAGGAYGETGVCEDCRICVSMPEIKHKSFGKET